MDFGALPPEINSARTYAGPGAAPMLAAASAWDSLAAELRSTAAAYQAVITGLASEGWMGPASAAMAAAAAPYAMWMSTTAAQAEQTGVQAKAAAGAYEAAFAMTVPPPVIAANRALLQSLVATNVLGQNTPAIATTEAHYSEMWAQDAAAMYTYAASSAAASKLTPFAAPQQNTNPAAEANQSAAVAQATGTSAGTATENHLSQLTTAIPGTLQSLASPTSPGTGSGLSGISDSLGIAPGDFMNAGTNLMSSSFSPMGLAGITQIGSDLAVVRGAMIAPEDPLGLGALEMAALTPTASGPGSAIGALGAPGLGGALSAGMGRATTIGALSVPPSWSAATPAASSPVAPLSGTSLSGAVSAAGPGGVPGMPGMPVAGSGSRGLGFAAPRYGFKPTVMPRPVVVG